MAGWWAQRAERVGLIGLSSTNTHNSLVPTRASDVSLSMFHGLFMDALIGMLMEMRITNKLQKSL